MCCVFAEDSIDMGRLSAQATSSLRGESEHARPQHFADQPRVIGKVDPELLLSPQCRGFTLTTGLSPLEFPTQHSYVGTWCHWHLCSSRLLGQSAYATHISFFEWLRV